MSHEAGFTRFVTNKIDEDSGRRQGLFHCLEELDAHGLLLGQSLGICLELQQWFRLHLTEPKRFARAARPHAKGVALSWFKNSAVEHIQWMRRACALVEMLDVTVVVLKTRRPGYIVYEDDHQVVAEPICDTPT